MDKLYERKKEGQKERALCTALGLYLHAVCIGMCLCAGIHIACACFAHPR